jgi:hypothetical protein
MLTGIRSSKIAICRVNVTGMNYTIKAGDLLYHPVDMPSAMYVVGDENLKLVSIYAQPSNVTRTYV